MKRTAIALAFAMSVGTSGAAFAQNAISCSISCGTAYNQCMANGVDWSFVTTASEMSSRMSSNMSAARSCREEATACYAGCAG